VGSREGANGRTGHVERLYWYAFVHAFDGAGWNPCLPESHKRWGNVMSGIIPNEMMGSKVPGDIMFTLLSGLTGTKVYDGNSLK